MKSLFQDRFLTRISESCLLATPKEGSRAYTRVWKGCPSFKLYQQLNSGEKIFEMKYQLTKTTTNTANKDKDAKTTVDIRQDLYLCTPYAFREVHKINHTQRTRTPTFLPPSQHPTRTAATCSRHRRLDSSICQS